MKIVVCDDCAEDRTYLSELAGRWAERAGLDAQISRYESAEQLLLQHGGDIDLLLLDIEMGDMDGVALARELRQRSETLQIVFVTGYDDYIAEGYDVSALHYLMKPVQPEKLFAVLDRAKDRLQKAERTLTFEAEGELIRLPLHRIRYADVRLNYVTLHADKDYTVKKPLSEIARELDERFFRVGRSAIVNLTLVSRVTKTDIILRTGETVPMPRGAWESVNQAILRME